MGSIPGMRIQLADWPEFDMLLCVCLCVLFLVFLFKKPSVLFALVAILFM